MEDIGVGIIGTGGIADACHGPAVKALDGTFLRAVLSREETTGLDFLDRHAEEGGGTYTALEEFAADPSIDLVIVCSPDRLHVDHASVCLANGKHVLLEKPMSVSASGAAGLVRLARSKGLTLAVGFHLRSHVGHRALRARIQQGELGALRHIRVIWAFPRKDDSDWRAQPALGKWWSLAAVGTHCLDLARWFADDQNDWRQFSAVVSNSLWHGPHDESAVIAAQLSTGATVEVVSSVQFGAYHRVELFGEYGMATCQDTLGRDGAGEIRVNGEPLDFTQTSPFVSQLKNVVTCLASGATPRADGMVGLRAVQDLLLASTTYPS